MPSFLSSLRVRLFLLVQLALLPALALIVYAGLEQRRATLAAAENSVQQWVRLGVQDLTIIVRDAQQVLAVVAQLPDAQLGDPEACTALFAQLLTRYPRYLNIGAIRLDGTVACSALPFTGPVNASDRAYFQRALATREFSVGEFQVGRITGEPSLNFGHPLFRPGGDLRAVVFFALDLTWLNNSLAIRPMPPGAIVTVFDAGGTVVARQPEAEQWVGRSAAETPVYRMALAAGGGGSAITAGIDGVERLYGFARISPGPSAEGLYLGMGFPVAAILSEADRQLTRNVLLFAIVVLIAGAAGWFGGETMIVRPVRALVGATRRLATGDLSARTGVKGGAGELSQLARSFDAMAEALEASEARLRQAQKMEAIGLLAGGVAHDFNNLLTAIIGFSELAAGQLSPEHPLQGHLRQVIGAGERAAGLTRQLLAFSRQQVLQPEVLDLNAVVTDMTKLLRRVIGEDVEVTTRLEPRLGTVLADPGQVSQVILNLATNARDAMPNGGQLIIETTNVELDEGYARAHGLTRTGRHVMLAISDTGQGMDAEIQARIFEPFFTTKEMGRGTGLGLATVYGIVKQSGGEIWVYSEPGHGTTFKVYLPRHEPVGEERSRDTAPVIPGGRETVLLAEDEEAVRGLTIAVLEASGYRVLAASGPEEALALCRDHGGPIHLLLTDLVMPRMDGRALADRVMGLRPEVKVLYMSGYTSDVALRHGVVLGSTHYLQKPFTPTLLTSRVRDVLDTPAGQAGQPKEVSSGEIS